VAHGPTRWTGDCWLIIASCGLAAGSVLLWLQAALALNNVWVVLCLLSCSRRFYAVNSPTRPRRYRACCLATSCPAANSLNMTVMQFGAIVGPLLAGVMLRWVDLSTLYLIDAITCVAPIWVTFRSARCHHQWRSGRPGLGIRRGHGRVPLPGGQSRGADVVRRRPDRDGPRHAARAFSRKWAPKLRRAD